VQNGFQKHGLATERRLEYDLAGQGRQRGVAVGDAVRALHVGFPA